MREGLAAWRAAAVLIDVGTLLPGWSWGAEAQPEATTGPAPTLAALRAEAAAALVTALAAAASRRPPWSWGATPVSGAGRS